MSHPHTVLIATYELGRQPFGLASAVAWLRRAGIAVTPMDLAVQQLNEEAVRRAVLVAFSLPMHTATRIAVPVLKQVRELNPSAHLCAYGLYAPANATYLRELGVETILGGEFEEGLLKLARHLGTAHVVGATGHPADSRATDLLSSSSAGRPTPPPQPTSSLPRQRFLVPDRSDLPPLHEYAHLTMPDGARRTVGYTEATRGCKHFCRHCPIVPVYRGQFRVVSSEIVLEDVRRQVAMGADHITFGDPDFLNGPRHALQIAKALHAEHPDLSYDITVKVTHLIRHADRLEQLRDTGCAFVTTAIESLDDRVLALLDKGHTRADVFRLIDLMDRANLPLQPTFVAFTPWTTLKTYEDLLVTLVHLDLIENVAPIQLAIRLLIPAESRLLELPELRDLIGPFDRDGLGYTWIHPDRRVDKLQADLQSLVSRLDPDADRRVLFHQVWDRLQSACEQQVPTPLPPVPPGRPRATIPYLSEPWYC